MNRTDFATEKRIDAPIDYSVFRNKLNVEYVEVLNEKGDKVCAYITLLYIEKSRNYYNDDVVEWRANPRFARTQCIKCFKIVTDDYEEHGVSTIKVSNTRDMLPLYMKWALRLGGAKFDEEGYIDNESYGDGGEKLHNTLSGLYMGINGKFRVKDFTEHRCEKCKNEWIVFEEEPEDE